MEQRQVRLGDVLDDYCPRERRVTNHAVVAIVGDQIKMTRCTTCDNEHPYKEAKVPPRRQTKLVAALAKSEDGPAPALAASKEEAAPSATPIAPAAAVAEVADVEEVVADMPAAQPSPPRIDSVRRPLIRATLARPEGTTPPARVPPVFTIRESGRDAILERGASGNVAPPPQQQPSRKRRNGRSGGGEVNGNRIDGHQGQSTRQGQNKNGNSRSSRNRNSGNRSERQNRGQRNRGKGRSR